MKKLLRILLSMSLILFIQFRAESQINCPTPGGLFANVSQSFALLHWGAVPGAYFYEISYRPVVSSSSWITDTTSANYYLAQPLSAGVTYEWKVRSACSNALGTPIVYSPHSPSVFFTVPGGIACMVPVNLMANNVSASFAVISWNAVPGAIGYNYRWRKANMNLSWTTGFTNNTSAGLSPLSAQTLYEYQVEALCPDSNGTVTGSGYSNSSYFTTQSNSTTCVIPLNLHVTNITQTSVVLNWSSTGASQYSIRYRVTGTNSWTYLNSQTNSKNVNGLMAFTQYEWQVRSKCLTPNGAYIFSNFSIINLFTTQNVISNCLIPQNLMAHNITNQSALLTWSNTGAIQYSIRYRIAGNNPWIYLNSQTFSKLISGLNPMTVYEWQVRSKCLVPGAILYTFSPFSPSHIFTTLNNNTFCPVPTNLTFTYQVGSAIVAWSNTGAGQYSLRIRQLNSSTPSPWMYLNAQTNSRNLDSLSSLGVYEWQVRSKCMTPNGSFIYSNWSVPNIFTVPPAITLYPNPARESISIQWNSAGNISEQIRIRNAYGMIRFDQTNQSREGQNSLFITTESLEPGMYFIEISSNTGLLNRKFYILR